VYEVKVWLLVIVCSKRLKSGAAIGLLLRTERASLAGLTPTGQAE
jgi:hypothetical protein